MQIGRHPHIGLQTVMWSLAGELLHLDSLGSEQPDEIDAARTDWNAEADRFGRVTSSLARIPAPPR